MNPSFTKPFRKGPRLFMKDLKAFVEAPTETLVRATKGSGTIVTTEKFSTIPRRLEMASVCVILPAEVYIDLLERAGLGASEGGGGEEAGTCPSSTS